MAAGETKKGRELVARALEMNPAFDATGASEAEALLRGPVAAR